MTDMHKEILQFKDGSISWNSVFKTIYQCSKKYLLRYSSCEESIHDFLYDNLEFLERLCHSYQDYGKDFRNFLLQRLDWRWLSHLRTHNRKKTLEEKNYQLAYYMENFHYQECNIAEKHFDEIFHSENYYKEHKILLSPNLTLRKTIDFKTLTLRSKRILLIACKNCMCLNDHDWDRLSKTTNIATVNLLEIADQLRILLIDKISKRRTKHLSIIQRKFLKLNMNITKTIVLKPIYPTHADIATVLNLKKSTVDSILYNCRILAQNGKEL